MTSDNTIKHGLQELASKYNAEILNIIQLNLHKGQATAVMKISDQRCLLKYWHNTPRRVKAEASIEDMSNVSNFLPEVIAKGANHIVLRYYESLTLRQFIKTNRCRTEITQVIRNIDKFITSYYQYESYFFDEEVNRRVTKRFKQLMVSGQWGLNRSSAEKTFARAACFLLAPMYRYSLPYQEGKAQIIHADFHPNNIIVLPDLTVKIIDWEDCRYGSAYEDLMFLTPIISKLLPREHEIDFPWLKALPKIHYAVNRFATLANRCY